MSEAPAFPVKSIIDTATTPIANQIPVMPADKVDLRLSDRIEKNHVGRQCHLEWHYFAHSIRGGNRKPSECRHLGASDAFVQIR